jgi:integrase
MATPSNHTHVTPVDIGPFRKLRLKVNRQGYFEVWWSQRIGRRYLTKHESCRTKILAEARAYLDAFCASIRTQADTQAAGITPTIEALCARWLDHVARDGKDRTGKHVLAPIRRELGRLTAAQLHTQLFQDYEKRRGVAPGTVRRELGGLRTVLVWASEMKLIRHDDLPSFKKDVLPAEGAPRDKFLTASQERALWDKAMAWDDARVKLFIALGLETAARREAILDLTWDRVDLDLKQIDYRVPGRRVTKKRRVRVPISDRLMPVLLDAYADAEARVMGPPTGRVIGVADIRKPLDRFLKEAGVPWVTPHVLRHTWGSLKAMKGAPLYDIASVMGDTIATINKYYLHLTPDHLRSVINL